MNCQRLLVYTSENIPPVQQCNKADLPLQAFVLVSHALELSSLRHHSLHGAVPSLVLVPTQMSPHWQGLPWQPCTKSIPIPKQVLFLFLTQIIFLHTTMPIWWNTHTNMCIYVYVSCPPLPEPSCDQHHWPRKSRLSWTPTALMALRWRVSWQQGTVGEPSMSWHKRYVRLLAGRPSRTKMQRSCGSHMAV